MGPRSSDEKRVAFLGAKSFNGSSVDADLDESFMKRSPTYKRPPHRTKEWLLSRVRTIRRSILRQPFHYLIFAIFLVHIATPIFAPSYTRMPKHYHELKLRCEGPNAMPGCANPFKEKVFISVSLYDKGGYLAAGRWGETVLKLIQMLGPENTFLSIYENDSPGGEAALEDFKHKVPCKHEIVYDAQVSLAGFENVTMPDGTKRMKRLSYLSEMRNRALKPLDRFQEETGISVFDKVLFLNDVLFHPVEAAQLLFSTNMGPDGRTQYLSVCALDYINPVKFYDLYAQRDVEGYSNGIPIFPIFSSAGQGLSRQDMLAQKDAVRVTSCWGGMVAMQAKYVQNLNPSQPTPDFQAIGSHVIDPAHSTPVEAPVRFRHEPEIFVDACECCLFLADVSTAARKDNAQQQGVFVNPYVRVAYEDWVLRWIPFAKRFERLFTVYHRFITWLCNLPRNNPYRTVQEGQAFMEETWNTDVNQWELVNRTGRSGLFCAVREMQLLQQNSRTEDKNWQNHPIPQGQALYFPT